MLAEVLAEIADAVVEDDDVVDVVADDDVVVVSGD